MEWVYTIIVGLLTLILARYLLIANKSTIPPIELSSLTLLQYEETNENNKLRN